MTAVTERPANRSRLRHLQILVGALAPPLWKQLKVKPALLKHQQKDADAIVRLRIRRLLTSSQSDGVCRRLAKEVARIVHQDRELKRAARSMAKRSRAMADPGSSAGSMPDHGR